jgi:hypothetical protein
MCGGSKGKNPDQLLVTGNQQRRRAFSSRFSSARVSANFANLRSLGRQALLQRGGASLQEAPLHGV